MNKRVRQGLGLALLGAAAWGIVALISVLADSTNWPVLVGLVLGLIALAGVVAAVGGVVVAGVSLIRDRS